MNRRTVISLSIAGALAALTLAACGGGSSDSSAGATASAASGNTTGSTTGNTTGSGATNTAVGSVTGFGSVVVDGIHYDDAKASVQRENAPGASALSEAKLGQRVLLTFDRDNKASKIEVLPELEGTIASIDTANSRFVVNSITVAVNADAAAGPLTVFGGGFTGFADLKANDYVEVHGMAKPDTAAGAAANSYVVQATRVEKETAPGPYLRAGGFVQNLATSAASTTFKLGGLTVDATGVIPRPTGATLADGKYVFVMSNLAVTGATMKASSVRIFERKPANANDIVRLAGKVDGYDAATVTFNLDGVAVNAKDAKLEPRNLPIGNGQYARVSGVFDANGVLVATDVKLRDESAPPVELKGTVANFVGLNDFSVRGVPIDASKATLTACPATGLADDQFVLLHGRVTLTSPKVQADKIVCTAGAAVPAGEIVGRAGVASEVDAKAMTLTLSLRGGAMVAVTWTDTTFFDGITVEALANGANLQVEGVLGAEGALTARKIRPAR